MKSSCNDSVPLLLTEYVKELRRLLVSKPPDAVRLSPLAESSSASLPLLVSSSPDLVGTLVMPKGDLRAWLASSSSVDDIALDGLELITLTKEFEGL